MNTYTTSEKFEFLRQFAYRYRLNFFLDFCHTTNKFKLTLNHKQIKESDFNVLIFEMFNYFLDNLQKSNIIPNINNLVMPVVSVKTTPNSLIKSNKIEVKSVNQWAITRKKQSALE